MFCLVAYVRLAVLFALCAVESPLRRCTPLHKYNKRTFEGFVPQHLELISLAFSHFGPRLPARISLATVHRLDLRTVPFSATPGLPHANSFPLTFHPSLRSLGAMRTNSPHPNQVPFAGLLGVLDWNQ